MAMTQVKIKRILSTNFIYRARVFPTVSHQSINDRLLQPHRKFTRKQFQELKAGIYKVMDILTPFIENPDRANLKAISDSDLFRLYLIFDKNISALVRHDKPISEEQWEEIKEKVNAFYALF